MGPRTTLLLAPLLLGMAACDLGGGTDTPPGGAYRAVLESPGGGEGAAAIELTGDGIESVRGDAGVHSQAAGATTRVVVLREPAGTIEFTVTMARGHAPPAARVVEVVDADDRPRASLAGYRVTFSR